MEAEAMTGEEDVDLGIMCGGRGGRARSLDNR